VGRINVKFECRKGRKDLVDLVRRTRADFIHSCENREMFLVVIVSKISESLVGGMLICTWQGCLVSIF
jgi:hypothetical protein